MTKRIIAVILCASLIFGSVGTVFADEILAESGDEEELFVEEAWYEELEAEADGENEPDEEQSDEVLDAEVEEADSFEITDEEIEIPVVESEESLEIEEPEEEPEEDEESEVILGASYTSDLSTECEPFYRYKSSWVDTLNMGGITFNDAVSCYVYASPRVGFNLGGLYDEVSFYTGHIDDTYTQVSKVTMHIFTDGEEILTQELKTADVPKKFSFPVGGVQHFEIAYTQAGIGDGCYFGIGAVKFTRSGTETGIGRFIDSNMIDECEPYAKKKVWVVDELIMGSIKFPNSVNCSTYYAGRAGFNLMERYTTVSFYAGHVDGTNAQSVGKVTMNVYLEGELYDSQELPVNDIPRYFSYGVAGVTQFEVEFTQSGLWDGCYYGIGGMMFLPESDHSNVTIDPTVSGQAGTTVPISGTLTLNRNEASESNLEAAVNALTFDTTDAAQGKVIACTYTPSDDFSSADLTLYTALYEGGTPEITVTSVKGQEARCKASIAAASTGQGATTNYAESLIELLQNQDTQDALKYLSRDWNFPASDYVYETDSQFGSYVVNYLTDLFFRKWDGLLDLYNGRTSIEEAEKVLAALLEAFQQDCEALATAKTAAKYASTICQAFNEYATKLRMWNVLTKADMETVKLFYSEDNIVRLLNEGKYEELKLGPGLAQLVGKDASKWTSLMEGFCKSGEIRQGIKNGLNVASKGLKVLGTCLELASMTEDTVNYYFRMESLINSNEMYCELLQYLRDHCYYSVVQEAAGNVLTIAQGGLDAALDDFVAKTEKLVKEKVIDTIIDVTAKGFVAFDIVKTALDVSTGLSNMIFSTGSTQERKDRMRILAYTGECIGRYVKEKNAAFISSKDEEMAKCLYHGMYMLWQTRCMGEKTLQSMLTGIYKTQSKLYAQSVEVSRQLETYRKHFFENKNLTALIGVAVSCPVELTVCDRNGNEVLTVGDGTECQGEKNGLYYYTAYNPLSQDYMKQVLFPKDGGYKVKLTGTGEGTVDCSVVSLDGNSNVVEKHFEDLPVKAGTEVEINNPAAETVQYVVKEGDSETEKTMYKPDEKDPEPASPSSEPGNPSSETGKTPSDTVSPDKGTSEKESKTKIANPMTVKTKSPSVKASKLKKKKQKIKKTKAFKISNAKGTVTFAKKGGSKKFSISKTGVITVKKGTKKGKYKIKVDVTASGDENYLPITKTVTVKVVVK